VIVTESEFFDHLEMRVSRELEGMRQKELRALGCDGFIPEEFNVVARRCRISGRVWLAFGSQSQECWQFVVHLGGEHLCREEIEWSGLLPAGDVTGWLSLDFDTKFMKINPQGADADGEPAAT
jgi:hypothetical protein